MRILVAEDDPVSLRLLQACLVEWGCKCLISLDRRQKLFCGTRACTTMKGAGTLWRPVLRGVRLLLWLGATLN